MCWEETVQLQLEQVPQPWAVLSHQPSPQWESHTSKATSGTKQRLGQRACNWHGVSTGKGIKIVLSHLRGCLCKLSRTCSGFWGSSSFLGRRASFSAINAMNPPTSQSQITPMGLAPGTSSSSPKNLWVCLQLFLSAAEKYISATCHFYFDYSLCVLIFIYVQWGWEIYFLTTFLVLFTGFLSVK